MNLLENAIWAKKTFQQFNDLVLKTEFVDFDKGENIDDDVDVIYVCGGNTYNLLVSSRSINFLEKLEKFFSRGGLYVGSSAGSVLVSRDIDSAGLIGSDKNKTDLKDFSGLQVIDKYIIPHSNSKDHQKVKQFMEEKNVGEEDFIFIEDNTAYYLRNGDMEKRK